jgi:hypothetical protein
MTHYTALNDWMMVNSELEMIRMEEIMTNFKSCHVSYGGRGTWMCLSRNTAASFLQDGSVSCSRPRTVKNM